MTDLQVILDRHKQAHMSTLRTREAAADDLVFARLTQWDDYLESVGLEYRGEFNLIYKEAMRLKSELRSVNIGANFKPDDGADPDAADILNGMFRAFMRTNSAKSAIDIAIDDVIDCGFGCVRMTTDYVNMMSDMDNRQELRLEGIHEANNNVYWDPNSRQIDKSDAKWCSVITQMTKEGFEELAEEYGFDPTTLPSAYAMPTISYVFPWNSIAKNYFVGEYYERVKKTKRITIMRGQDGETMALDNADLKDQLDAMIAAGWVTVGKKRVDQWEVWKYIVSGDQVLHKQRIAGQHIPIIPAFGNWNFVEGYEVWRGITRLAKDPQRLHNLMMSYIADIAAQGARNKPILHPEHVQGYQNLWDDPSKYRYLLVNRKAPNGEDLPPVGNYLQTEQIPQAIMAALETTRTSISDVTGPGMPQDVLNPDASGVAVMAMQARVDNQSFVFLDNMGKFVRRIAEVWVSAASEVYDTQQTVTTITADGAEGSEVIFDQVQDMRSGEWVTLNDISRGQFSTHIEIGQSWESQKQQARQELVQMMQSTQDPQLAMILQYQYLMLLEGEQNAMLRKFARRQLLQMGMIEPQSDEDIQYLQQLQQQAQQPDPSQMAMVNALQAQAIKDEASAQKSQADMVKALADAERARAQTSEILANTDGKALDNAERMALALRGDIRQQIGKTMQ